MVSCMTILFRSPLADAARSFVLAFSSRRHQSAFSPHTHLRFCTPTEKFLWGFAWLFESIGNQFLSASSIKGVQHAEESSPLSSICATTYCARSV
jgi:hypothetical protein